MSKIKVLPKELINQIAAGEVVERPASVIKELIENSIDAGSSKIIIKIQDAGKTLIEIEDDGVGMNKDDAELALIQHATSKISDLNDLYSISTLGFRGEALASISSVSGETIIDTKSEGNDSAKAVYKDSKIDIEKSARAVVGTKISIHNLFENVPARKKFLKVDATEKKHIYEMFLSEAFPFLDIHFELWSDDKLVYKLTKTDSIKNRIFEVYGKELTENSDYFSAEVNNIKISGILGNTFLGRKTQKVGNIYINNRAVKSNLINSAVSKGYEGRLHRDLKPSYILFLEINPADVDVNIHPRKLEVKFNDERTIFSTVFNFVSKNLDKKDKEQFNDSANLRTEIEFNNKPTNIVKREQVSIKPRKTGSVQSSFNFNKSLYNNLKIDNTQVESFEAPTQTDAPYQVDNIKSFHQIFNTYITFELNNEVWFVDQHAAAEKVLFEKLMEQNTEIQTRPLLIPEVVDLDSKIDKERLLSDKDDFKKLGFGFEDFGDNSVQVFEVPELSSINSFHDAVSDFLKDEKELGILYSSEIESTYKITKEQYLRIATTACHSAIRAGQVLNQEEMKNLVNDVLILKSIPNCPHGRPIYWRLSKSKIENNFNRDI